MKRKAEREARDAVSAARWGMVAVWRAVAGHQLDDA